MHHTFRNPRRSVSHRLLALSLAVASLLLVAALYYPASPDPVSTEPQAVIIVAPEQGLFDVSTVEKLLVDALRQLQAELEELIQALNGDQEMPSTAQQPVWKTPHPAPDQIGPRSRPILIQL